MTNHDDEEVKGESEKQGFKVVDRRRFDESGDVREDGDDAQGVPQAQSEQLKSEASATTEESDEPAEKAQGEPTPITFSLFVQTLAHQSMMSLGLIPWPDSGLTKTNLQHAKETIDVLGILQEKTKGNLDDSEQRLIDTVLYELRMTFMKVLEKDGSK